MDLELSEAQADLRDNIRAVLEGICPPHVVRGVYEGTAGAPDLWAQMTDLYWPALGVPESSGGLGMSFVEVGLLAEELGRAAAPGPLLATTSQFVPLLTELDATEPLADVASGRISGAVALAERNRWDPAAVETSATESGDSWLLNGIKPAVLSGAEVDTLAVVARVGGSDQIGVFLVPSSGVDQQRQGSMDPGLGLADIALSEAPATMIGEPGPATLSAVVRATEQATVAMALHTVGACRKIFEVTLEYAKVREQYDRVIGSFQALKHRFADLYLAVERANAVGYFAAVAVAEDDPRRSEATHLAKAAAGDCQRLVAEDGLQLHGGIGFTWENDLHFLLKRAKAGELLCGSSMHHRVQLAALLGLTPEEKAA